MKAVAVVDGDEPESETETEARGKFCETTAVLRVVYVEIRESRR